MKLKLIIKVVLLFFSLVAVILAMKLTASGNFKQGINQMFAADTTSATPKVMHWCPEHVVDFKWTAAAMTSSTQARWMGANPEQIKQTFCTTTMESVAGLDISQVQFKPLLQAYSAEAKTATLEWSPESNIFRVLDLPFKSSSLSRELLDDPK